MIATTGTTTTGIARFSLTSADPSRFARFYIGLLGFTPAIAYRVDASIYGATGMATVQRLRLGAQEIELVGFDTPGAPYPPDSTSHDRWFQHLALVTTDIAAAYARLTTTADWDAITAGSRPVQLPQSSGGVTAFKFRDPEGHPLELLEFPAGGAPSHWANSSAIGPCIGIDHSAIVVTDTDASIAFYEGFGLAVGNRSRNHGPEQQALDGVSDVAVDVTALSHDGATPHLELLAYATPAVRGGTSGPADIACTRSVLTDADAGQPARILIDPDGHRVILTG
ncbi:VOC family protein [Lichenicola sp.]|uniref:VOC family protein n=1 Tax=Lichenicola sp. TaxID=2804529 RepID=UPI003AFFE182